MFIDLGGVDGLVHITDLSWGRINHPEEFLELDQKVNVVILDFDDDKKRIALGVKQLQEHPWDKLDDKLAIGDNIKGKVVVVADYGAFIEVIPGVEGLVHVSEITWSNHLKPAQEFFTVGEEIEAQVLTLDREERTVTIVNNMVCLVVHCVCVLCVCCVCVSVCVCAREREREREKRERER